MNQYSRLLWIVLIAFIAISLENPIAVTSANDGEFSAMNAKKHIDAMAEEVHFMGTKSNRKVRDYILQEFAKMNIPTEIFIGNSSHEYGSGYKRFGKTENIIATIKGRSSEKAVVIAGHYDSVLNSPAAADDVHAVANILETAKLLKDGNLLNDIVFIITDGEEMGLFGAKAYSESQDVSNIGLLLNYESRGNSGPSIAFEWSDGNGWLVRQLRKAANRPLANSMSYEIYKRLPNDTDFTYFKKAGVKGINHAFLDGFSYYHNPVDDPENINLNSVQHAGENMYRLTKHFANTDLTNVVAKNASFFNLLGTLIIYPSSWDLLLVVLTILLIVFVIYTALKSEQLGTKSLVLGLLSNIGIIVLSGGLTFGLSKLLFIIYPQYSTFYAGQFYNHKWYLLAAAGIAIIVFWLITKLYSRKNDIIGLQAGGLVLLGFFAIGLYTAMPTASYFMIFPGIVLALIFWYNNRYPTEAGMSIHQAIVKLASVIPLGMWFPVTITFFLAFSIVGLPGPVILICLICVAITICFKQIWTDSKMLPYLGLGLFFMSMIAAHLTSAPTHEKPIPSSAYFLHNVDSGQSHYVTNDKNINIGNSELMNGYENIDLNIPNITKRMAVSTNVLLNIPVPNIEMDSLNNSLWTISSQQEVYQTRLVFENTMNIATAMVDDQILIENGSSDAQLVIDLFGFTASPLALTIIKKDTTILQNIGVASRFESMPKDIIPDNARRKDGYTAIIQNIKL